jgi:hypothetical protein
MKVPITQFSPNSCPFKILLSIFISDTFNQCSSAIW